MVEEQAFAAIHRGYASHLDVGKLEIEHLDVLPHPLGPHRLLNDDHVTLDQPAQDDLRDRLVVGGTDLSQRRIGEEIVLAFGERPP